MSITVGQALLKQLQATGINVNRDDYFNEEENEWNVAALEQDLRSQQRRMKEQANRHTQSMATIGGSNSDTTIEDETIRSSQAVSVTASVPKPEDNITTETVPSMTGIAPESEGSSCAMVTVHALKEGSHQIQSHPQSQHQMQSQPQPHNPQLAPPQNERSGISSVTTRPAQMPSPNASPSIDYNNEGTESDREVAVQPQPQMVSLQAMGNVPGHNEKGQNLMVNTAVTSSVNEHHSDHSPTSASSSVSNGVQSTHSVSVHSASLSVHQRPQSGQSGSGAVTMTINGSHSEQTQSIGNVAVVPSSSSNATTSRQSSTSPSRKRKSNKSRSTSPATKLTKKGRPGRKRKNIDLPVGSSLGGTPPTKRFRSSRTVAVNEWNDKALKKLNTLKRSVKNSNWFWEPVQEVKHSAQYYPLVCPQPSDYGTICSKLEERGYSDLDAFLRDCELVFINARMYNVAIHAVHRASLNLEKKFKELISPIVQKYYKQHGSDRTWHYWISARSNYKPFAVPIDD